MRRIKLSKGYSAIVDDEDYEYLSRWKWFAQKMAHTVYAARKPWIAGGKGKSTKIFMHRIIAKTPSNLQTDHKDGDGLNNRRSNLRSVTRSDNTFNRVKWRKGCESKYRGVYLDKRDGVWFSNITINGKSIYIGRFKKEKDAAIAYRLKIAEIAPNKFIRKGVL